MTLSTATPGSIRQVAFGTCAARTCDHDAEYELLHAPDEAALWVPLCVNHLTSGPADGVEYVIEVVGFIPPISAAA